MNSFLLISPDRGLGFKPILSGKFWLKSDPDLGVDSPKKCYKKISHCTATVIELIVMLLYYR
ncbi:hypothetical protein QUB63_12140 [Microcoleus sp. ARI1-B5]|uniref:hypothetical protein n=1 Tax=unclassified Microcoleus TaxID=2642155 RepID=UPI002FD1E729